MRIAFLGLGVMGFPMAGHLAKAGHNVTVYNRSSDKAQRWQRDYGGNIAPTPAEAAADAELVAMCVGADRDVLEVALGPDGALGATTASAGRPGSSRSARTARKSRPAGC